jgi:dipeptidyl aminopeptidase/acylaminoacyl peptidase
VSDAFLGVQSLYSQDLAIPPPYDTAIAALGRPDRDPAFFFAYSPVLFADRLPPTLIVHTYADEVIPYNQATALDQAMTAAGVPHDLLLYEDTTHYLDAYRPTQATHMVYERIVAFAKEYAR